MASRGIPLAHRHPVAQVARPEPARALGEPLDRTRDAPREGGRGHRNDQQHQRQTERRPPRAGRAEPPRHRDLDEPQDVAPRRVPDGRRDEPPSHGIDDQRARAQVRYLGGAERTEGGTGRQDQVAGAVAYGHVHAEVGAELLKPACECGPVEQRLGDQRAEVAGQSLGDLPLEGAALADCEHEAGRQPHDEEDAEEVEVDPPVETPHRQSPPRAST